jgi:hypothetical protein
MAYRECTHYCPHVRLSDEISIEGISEQIFPVFILTLTSVYAVIQASYIPHPIASRNYAFVEIIAGNDSHHTESVKLKKNAFHVLGCSFHLVRVIYMGLMPNSRRLDSPSLNGASNITFSVFHDSLLHNKCLGRVEISVRALKRQCQQTDKGECLLFLMGSYHTEALTKMSFCPWLIRKVNWVPVG